MLILELKYCILLCKVQCFIGILSTDKIIYDNFTCENHRISRNHHSLPMNILYC